MGDAAESSYRAWLGLAPGGEESASLARWLRQTFEGEPVSVADERDLIVRVVGLAGRRRRALGPLAERLPDIDPAPVRLEFGPVLKALPSPERPLIYLLPARCRGLARLLCRLAPAMPPDRGPARLGLVRPYLLAGRVGPALGAPVRRPPRLPEELRGPFDAVRFGLYCSQTTPERYRLDPLAQVKLSMAAAVR